MPVLLIRNFIIGIMLFPSSITVGQVCSPDKNGINSSGSSIFFCPAGSIGNGNLPAASDLGQIPISTGPGATYLAQTAIDYVSQSKNKPFIDVRTIAGIDCTGTNDNASAWNTYLLTSGDDTSIGVPNGCIQRICSTVTVSSRAGFKLFSFDRAQNGGGNNRPEFLWCGSTGGMWDFQANQAPTIEGFFFTNGSTNHLDYFLRFDGNPAAHIGTEAMVRYNTFTNNQTNPTVGGAGVFDAITINQISGQNHEKNVITDNDFFCSQSIAFRESDSTQISSGSPNITCGLANCTYTTDASVGDRIRVSYSTGIFDSTIQSITDNNHLVATSNAASTQSNARLHFRQAYGNGITIGSVNSKHNTIDRNSFTQCARGINVINGSFSLSHVGGSANDVLIYLNDVSEPTEIAYVEDESTLRDVFTGPSMDAPVIMNHLRNSLGISGEFDGFIFFSGGGRFNVLASVLQDTPKTNQVVFGAAAPANVQLASIGNTWSPGVATLSNLGFSQWQNLAVNSAGWLVSCSDYGVSGLSSSCTFFGTTQYMPSAFARLYACNAANEGSEAAINDSTTSTWGATITGLGTNHVKAYCDGTSWTVEAK